LGCSNLTSIFFYPQQQYLRTPADINLVYEEVSTYTTDGTEINSWFLPAFLCENKKFDAPIVLFLHGNAENISTHIGSVYWLPEQGVNVFLLDYRGFGRSFGDPSIPAIFQDVESSLIWLRDLFPQRKIFIFGQSIGAAVATTSIALFNDQYNLAGLILDSSFTGYRDIAQHVTLDSPIAWIAWPFTWLLPTEWDPASYVAQISPKPFLMFHSQTDSVLPYSLGWALYEQTKEPKEWFESKGGAYTNF
jgi:pimeloyl-ACP methyl ester carboxylesterase